VSYAIDVNVLLYASDASSPRHAAAVRFLADCARGPEICCFAWTTLVSYLRIATHPAIFATPLAPAQAEANVAALLELPHVRALGELDGFWRTYATIANAQPIRGNLVPDAHLAAILHQHGVRTLYTADADFRRFDHLDVRDPTI
jgi:toxin-antitoxin system PIN domain toxin